MKHEFIMPELKISLFDSEIAAVTESVITAENMADNSIAAYVAQHYPQVKQEAIAILQWNSSVPAQ